MTITTQAKSPVHISGVPLVTGSAKFICDETKPQGMVYVKPIFSKFAHARILNIDASEALAIPGVIAFFSAKDIPGENQVGHAFPDTPLLPEEEVMYVGQVVALLVATDLKTATFAAKLVKVEYAELPPILTIEDAIKAKSFYVPERVVARGDVDKALAAADFVVESEINTGFQEHIYLETQSCRAIPGDDHNITIFSSSQGPTQVQEKVAKVLGINAKDVIVDVKRVGGGFGGKESAPELWSSLTALAAFLTKRPAELRLTRHEDIVATGKRHPFYGKYKIGFNKDGKIVAYDLFMASNGGAFTDLSIPILERAIYHADNAYYLPNVRITAVPCKTNLTPNTAFRGFGAPQGIFIIEHAMDKVAHKLKIDPVVVREINLYQPDQLTPFSQPVWEANHPTLFTKLKEKIRYQDLLNATNEFNKNNKFVKRGLSVMPVKFGISFSQTTMNQGSALVWIYTDGTVIVSHGGVEMGQGLNTKVAQIVAKEFGLDMSHIRVESTNTSRIGNTPPTAASTGTDLNCSATYNAVMQIKEKLNVMATELLVSKNAFNGLTVPAASAFDTPYIFYQDNYVYDWRNPAVKISFAELVTAAHLRRICLGAHGFYKTPGLYNDRQHGRGHPFHYFVFGVAVTQVEVDVLTGGNRLLKVSALHDIAHSLNQGIDINQAAGAIFQGYGYSTMEEEIFDIKGRYLADTLSTYKIPTFRDLPEDLFEIEIFERQCQHSSVYGSKALGEPPLIYGLGAWFAIKHAISSLNPNTEVMLAMPATPEAVLNSINKLLI
ncbi:MAG: molybdopterin-dependent oxidoreductase [Gammaproteobacteria bacterium]|nr:molybdopterin-dependent oxidoreductase [Gammaproteobacteria bacterium]